jgi:hypothetical protein
MGSASDRHIREQDLGCSLGSDSLVCAECIEDEGLAAVIRSNPTTGECSFCRQSTLPVGELALILERIATALRVDYSSAEEELLFDRESESGWGGDVMAIHDVLYEIDFQPANEDLFDEICSAFSERQFCNREYGLMRPNERLRWGWRSFAEAVKHLRRFTFWSMEDDPSEADHPDSLPVGKMLDELGTVVRVAGVLKELPVGERFWRVRQHEAGVDLFHDEDLSPPPVECACQANRMSPAGVSMFYGAEDWHTAVLETTDPVRDAGNFVTGGQFRSERTLQILDLVDLPDPPSYFDVDHRASRLAIAFLRRFRDEVSKPIDRDDRAHVEYVPTQAFTEYVRFQMTGLDDKPIDGIRYRSARTGRANVVLFCGQDECIDEPSTPGVERWLVLEPNSRRSEAVEAAHSAAGACSQTEAR